MSRKIPIACLALTATFAGALGSWAQTKEMSKSDRSAVLEMLNEIARDVQKHYYDENFHGVDWAAKVQETKEKIEKETSLTMALGDIALALDSLREPNTIFIPPPRLARFEYGFRTEVIGDKCEITRVRPGSDAEAQGVRPGDEVLTFEGYQPTRENLWRLGYRLNILEPQTEVRLVIRNPHSQERKVSVKANIKQEQRAFGSSGGSGYIHDPRHETEREFLRLRPRSAQVGGSLLIVKLSHFLPDNAEIDGLIGDARKHDALVLDLRENGIGDPGRLEYLVGGLFPGRVKIADRLGRVKAKPLIANSRGSSAFAGKLVVLVDSRTTFVAELLARVVQLEKRGIVVGDQTAGMVIESKRYSYHMGAGIIVPYGAWIGEFDLIMSDGKSLEHVGVTPDRIILPSGLDLTAGRDPVLAYAATILGVKLTPEDAGKLFPYKWPDE